jgi:transcriptional regulator GlxA family with amidase domain
MAFITYERANAFLDQNKVAFADDEDLTYELQRAQNLIKGALVEVYGSAYTTWVSPETTPGLVQDIAAALCAAWRYAKKYSEESSEENSFAVRLEANSMAALDGVASGKYVLVEAGVTPGTQITSDDFFPNDSSSDYDAASGEFGEGGPKFYMGLEF